MNVQDLLVIYDIKIGSFIISCIYLSVHFYRLYTFVILQIFTYHSFFSISSPQIICLLLPITSFFFLYFFFHLTFHYFTYLLPVYCKLFLLIFLLYLSDFLYFIVYIPINVFKECFQPFPSSIHVRCYFFIILIFLSFVYLFIFFLDLLTFNSF